MLLKLFARLFVNEHFLNAATELQYYNNNNNNNNWMNSSTSIWVQLMSGVFFFLMLLNYLQDVENCEILMMTKKFFVE